MPLDELPLDNLPGWCRLNNVTLYNVKIGHIQNRGTGIAASRNLSAEETFDSTTLISVPRELILSDEAIEEYSKEDKDFRELLHTTEFQSPREKILLFLLVQLSLSSSNHQVGQGISHPWTSYIRFLPGNPLLPTLWSDEEKALLKGTSLEGAVSAKLAALSREFEVLRDASSDMFSWYARLWERRTVSWKDWVLVDALFRSRCLELSNGQSVMIPCIDMANHSATGATARYEANSQDQLVLTLREGCTVREGQEITISYGEKSAAEMLFSYGFIDVNSGVNSLVIPLKIQQDDPLAKAKLFSFGKPPTITIFLNNHGKACWESPFAYYASLNEEDGLEFKVLQETGGFQELKVFWAGADVTERTGAFETHIQNHPQKDVFNLRAVSIVLDHVQLQLASLSDGGLMDTHTPAPPIFREECIAAASELRKQERQLLENALEVFDEERSQLISKENVMAYLGKMENAQDEGPSEAAPNDEDFS